jgi:hypothetical protein
MADMTGSEMARGQPDGFVALGLAVMGAVVIAGGAGQLVDYGLDLHIAALDSSGDGGVLGVASLVAWSRRRALPGWCSRTPVR